MTRVTEMFDEQRRVMCNTSPKGVGRSDYTEFHERGAQLAIFGMTRAEMYIIGSVMITVE